MRWRRWEVALTGMSASRPPVGHDWCALLNSVLPVLPFSFPDPRQAGPRGLVARGGDLSVANLLLAYRRGIFPWSARPVTWWSPDPRAVIELDRVHLPRRLARTIRQQAFEVTRDLAFRRVIEGCAAAKRRFGGNWIAPEFVAAYTHLHEAGHAHSVECWRGGELVGGVYGVAVGGLFSGESMFHRADNASKIALAHLVTHLRERGFVLFDIQMVTSVTATFGAVEIRRDAFLDQVASAVERPCNF